MKFSVIVPVYSEEENIADCLAHARAVFRDAEIIVSDGHPERTTLAVIEEENCVKLAAPKGRGVQLQAGLDKASGDIAVFLHADTRLPENAAELVENTLGSADACAFDLAIDSDGFIFRIIEKTGSLRSRLTLLPYGDQCQCVRRDFALSVGGFRPMPIMEDVDFMRRVKRFGGKIKIIPEKAATSARRWKDEGILRCTLRNWALISLYMMGVSPFRLASFYKVSQKS
jgi:rSAM/selenodomain-associated transferase 2